MKTAQTNKGRLNQPIFGALILTTVIIKFMAPIMELAPAK